jgi:hypothetical protein
MGTPKVLRYWGLGEIFTKLDEDEEEKRMMKKNDYGSRAGENKIMYEN